MATGLFVDAGGIGGEVVIETVEQDSLATGNEPLDVGATEVEMPYPGIQELLLPGAKPGKRCVHDGPPVHAVWELGGERVTHHIADVMRHERDSACLELIENPRDVASLTRLLVPALRMRRQSHAAKIGNDDGVILDQDLSERLPHVAGVAEAVQQQYGGTRPADANVQRGSRHGHLARLEVRQKRLDLGECSSGEASNEHRGTDPREHECGKPAMGSTICASHALFAPPKISDRRLLEHHLEAAPRSRQSCRP